MKLAARTLLGLVAATLVVWLTLPLWGPPAGRFLEARDALVQADAIVVLGGNAPERLRHGQDLFEQGYAPLLIVSNEALRSHGIDTTWWDLHKAGFASPELSDDRLVVIDPIPESTADEARRTAVILQQRRLKSMILVTDPFHSRRASALFAAEMKPHSIRVISSPATVSPIDLSRWWETPRSASMVTTEWAKLLVYTVRGDVF